MRIPWIMIGVGLLLGACGRDMDSSPAPQRWLGNDIVVETRPAPVQAGMNEFLIIATQPNRLPVDDLVVSIRLKDTDPWSQAIQDGHTGVFRKAISFSEGERVLQVRLKQGAEEGQLNFPLP